MTTEQGSKKDPGHCRNTMIFVGDPSKIRPYSSFTDLLFLYFLSLPSVSEDPKTREKQNNYIKKTALKCKTTSVINN